MTHILHRQIHHSYPVAVGGEGVEMIDSDGRRYIDASGGAAVSCLGHQHPEVLAAMHAQLDKLAYAHTSFFTSDAAEALADELVAHAPGDLGHVYFVSGGSEGVETALKMARQYFVERGEPERRRFIARYQSYHGNTLGALSVGGNRWRKAPFEPILVESDHIDPCYAYRHQRPGESIEDYSARAAGLLEAKLQELGPETVIAFVAETVVGATLGAVPPEPGYFKRIREICDRHGILLILDEVMCGMGRTGTLHACEQDGVAPDLMVVAKGLGGGYAPLGAVFASDRLFDAFASGSGTFLHGHTYIGHPLACSAGLAVQQIVRRDNLLANVKARGADLERRLSERFGNHHHVGDIHGRGLFRGIELVADRSSKTPFDPTLKLHARIKAEAMKRGLMVYPQGGTMDGRAGDHVLIAPPFIVDAATVDTIVDRLGDAVDAAISEIRS
ncbi:MAG: aspartate aminotransferase family protein [Rhizobiaceae bacterium]|nr:MAG: aspartate aminotransferase family protein [Rhizobiaceae bacterium]